MTGVPPLDPGDSVGDDAAVSGCPHLEQIRDVTPSTPDGCTECLAMGSTWVHLGVPDVWARRLLRLLPTPARDRPLPHDPTPDHPFQPGESWRWCYVDERLV